MLGTGKKACLALLISLLGSAPSVRALSLGVGLTGGLNLGDADVDGQDETDGRQGMALGGMVELGVTSPYSLLVEPMYVQKGARFDVLGVTARGNFDYLEIPVLLKAKFGKTAGHAFVFAGPSLGINLMTEGKALNGTAEFKDEASTVVLSGDIGAGGAFAVSKFVYLSADVRYSHGFTNALDESVGGIDSWYSRDIRILGGILFHMLE